MRQHQLVLTLKVRGNHTRREVYRRNQPLAEWWFQHIRASLKEEEPYSAPWPIPTQEKFRWR